MRLSWTLCVITCNLLLISQATGQQQAPVGPTTPTVQSEPVSPSDINPSNTAGIQASPQPQNISPDVQRQVSRNTRSATQFQTSNLFARGSGRINIMSDIFGVGQNQVTVLFPPFTFKNVGGIPNGAGFAFDLGNNSSLDLFTTGLPDSNGNFELAEPVAPTDAPIIAGTGVFYAGGKASTTSGNNGNNGNNIGFSTFNTFDLEYAYGQTLSSPNGSGLLLGRQKLAANVSPIPRTRIFADYSYFDNTSLFGGIDVHRWTPGFEYAFDDETSSIEMRLPMGVTANSDVFSGALNNTGYEIGNLFLAWKSVLLEREAWLISGGVSVSAPTADDLNYFQGTNSNNAQPLLQIRNESVQVQPFLGWFAHHGKFFTQGFTQIDIDVNGSTVLVNRDLNQSTLTPLGVVQNTNLLYVDMQFGYWLKRLQRTSVHQHSAGLTGIAPVWELHVNRSLHANDVVGSTANFANTGGYQIGSPLANVQVVNTVVGLMLERDFDTQIYVGYATPLGNGVDNSFDGELRVALNRYF